MVQRVFSQKLKERAGKSLRPPPLRSRCHLPEVQNPACEKAPPSPIRSSLRPPGQASPPPCTEAEPDPDASSRRTRGPGLQADWGLTWMPERPRLSPPFGFSFLPETATGLGSDPALGWACSH